jgi:hypothetical protein
MLSAFGFLQANNTSSLSQVGVGVDAYSLPYSRQ